MGWMPDDPSPTQRPRFRFEDLEVWQRAAALAVRLHGLAGALDRRRFYRYAEQVRAAGLSLANAIAEGSSSAQPREFQRGLHLARASLQADASMLLVFVRMEIVQEGEIAGLLAECDLLSRKITVLSRSRDRDPAPRSESPSSAPRPGLRTSSHTPLPARR